MDLDRIERLIKLFGRSCARSLQVESDGWQLSVRRSPTTPGAPSAPPLVDWAASTEPEISATDRPRVSITAPLVGIFRQGGVQFEPGDRVQPGEPVGSIESMKILSPVLAVEGGEVEEVLVEDGQPVEFGHQLFLLQPLNGMENAEGEEP
jgi:biotin carboxyl carrier protein